MENSFLDLLGSSLVPVLSTDVTAGSSGNVHLALIGVSALGASPDQLTVLLSDLDLTIPAAFLTVVRLGVQLGVHDVVVDEFHQLQNS